MRAVAFLRPPGRFCMGLALLALAVAASAGGADGAGDASDHDPPATSADVSAPASDAVAPRRGSLLIVHTRALAPAAEAWSRLRSRQGWSVSPMRWDGGGAEALRDAIGTWARSATDEPKAVLLLGPVEGDGIPTFRFKQREPALIDRRDDSFVSDGPYQDLDDDGVPDLLLGRIPVASSEEALRVLAKIRAWESVPPREPHRRMEVVGGEGRFGTYDSLLELLTAALIIREVPPGFDLRVCYAKASSAFCPPPSMVRGIVRSQALSGALLFNYLGHGHATGLDALWWHGGRERLLEAEDLVIAGDEAVRPGGVALLVCCSAGWYDDESRGSLAESLLLHPRGPVAVLAGSRQTHPYANAIVEREAVRALLRDPSESVGAWDMAVTRHLAAARSDELDLVASPIAASGRWTLSLGALRRQHALLYNLIGDPTTTIVHPPTATPIELDFDAPGRLSGSLRSAPAEEPLFAAVEIVSRRHPTRRGIVPAEGPDDPSLEACTLRNWPRANEWTVWRGAAPLHDGRFEIDLPDLRPLEADHVVVVIRSGGADEGTLVAIASLEVASLLRSDADGQGLPSD